MITFASEKRPPVLDAIKEAGITHHGTFIFNNSALFVDPDKTPNGRIFWKMGKQGFKIFFQIFGKCLYQKFDVDKRGIVNKETVGKSDISYPKTNNTRNRRTTENERRRIGVETTRARHCRQQKV